MHLVRSSGCTWRGLRLGLGLGRLGLGLGLSRVKGWGLVLGWPQGLKFELVGIIVRFIVRFRLG